jgi:hypothetical protein
MKTLMNHTFSIKIYDELIGRGTTDVKKLRNDMQTIRRMGKNL